MKNIMHKLDLEQVMQEGMVDQYVNNQLTGDDLQAFETLLLDCSELQDEVETALMMKQGMNALDTVAAEKTERASWWQRLFSPRWAPAISGGFAAITALSLGLVISSQDKIRSLQNEIAQSKAPVTEISSITLPTVRSASVGRFEPMGILDRNQGQGMLLLSLELSFPDKEAYDVEIVSWPEQTVVERLTSVEPNELDNLVVALHAADLNSGDYVARVVYDSEHNEQLVGTYAFSVEEGSDSN